MISLIALPAAEGGFNPLDFSQAGVAFWTWLILLIALPFIWKFVMAPTISAMNARDDRATAAIAAAEKASADAQRARTEVEQKLAEARTEAQKMVADAKARAEAREKEMIVAAEKRAKEMEETARRAIEVEREKAISSIREQVVELSIQAAGRVLERNVGSDDDRRMVREMVAGKKG